jgi:HlyD family secretion protein
MRAIALIFAAALISGCSKPAEEEKEKPVVAVKVARARTADLPRLVTAPATIFPREQANVSARTTAPIRELKVHKGDSVKAGQALAVLENRDVTAQREEAQAAVADAEANLQKTVAGTVPADLERARGQLETAHAALEQGQKNYERRRRLFEQGAIPQKDLLQTQTEFATAKANFEVAQKSLELLQRQSGVSDIAMARARVEQAKAHLSSAQANVQYTELRSPVSGTITEQFQYPGDMAGPNTPTFTVMDLSTVTGRAQIPETSANAIERGQRCRFAGADSGVPVITGRITVVNRAVDPARRTVEVWCEITNPPAAVRAGVFGSVSVETASVRDAIVVPSPAVQVNEGTDTGVVFVVDQKRIAHKRDVTLGLRQADRVQIVSGIEPGELVVTEGGYALPDGTEVKTDSGPAKEAKQ